LAFSGPIRITVLGSGTSVGVPTIGCPCAVCHSDDSRDKRLRPSILVSYVADGQERNVLVDTTPDLRQQALSAGLTSVDGILYTHSHADHIMGLDDVRPFNYGRAERIPVYGRADTIAVLERIFAYAFIEAETHPGGLPRVTAHRIASESVRLHGLDFTPVPIWHGKNQIIGYRFGAAAYLTDNSDIPDSSLPLLEDLDVLFLDALRREPHPSHSTIDQALAWVRKLRPRRAFFTHICHDLSHAEVSAQLPDGVELAFDGLSIEVAGIGPDA
jgi:phosphoribosyl 1,2-cyclic phosphate phosphodiesterase